jgi:hypothetical protein
MDILVASSLLVLLAIPVLFAIRRDPEHGAFLTKLFLWSLALRAGVALVIYAFKLQEFFGGDANAYHRIGSELWHSWRGDVVLSAYAESRLSTAISGWGMYYWVAGLYAITGENMLATQFVNVAIGSLATIFVYFLGERVYRHNTVSRRAAMLVAFFPSIVLWSAQGLKDPLILVAICMVLYATVQLRERFSAGAVVLAVAGLFVLYALRFYVFYIMAAALAFSTVVSSVKTLSGFVRQTAGFAIVGVALLYVGVGEEASEHYAFVDLEKIQMSRKYMATAAASGFGADIDVRAQGGIAEALTLGSVYMMLAPFPWEMTNLRQAITIPEMLVWWAMIPLLVSGLWYSFRYRMAESSAITVFVGVLLLAYAIYMSNVGTAYRQRAQLLPFFFLFVAVGYTLREKRRAAHPH